MKEYNVQKYNVMKALKRIAALTVWMVGTIMGWSHTVVLECEDRSLLDLERSHAILGGMLIVHQITEVNRNPNITCPISGIAFAELQPSSSLGGYFAYTLKHPDLDNGFWDIT